MNFDEMQLSKDQQRTLFHTLRERNKNLLIVSESHSLSEDELLHICELLTEEMCDKGLDINDEPNKYGRALEDIIGVLIRKKIELFG